MDDAELFAQESARLLEALAEAQKFKKSETIRLSSITDTLLQENRELEKNLSSDAPKISEEVATILNEVPTKALTIPSTSMFDCLLPQLASYEIDFDDEFGDHEDYNKVITGFRRLQANENGFDHTAKSIQRLASDNYILRLRNTALATPEEQQRLLRIHGHPFNAKVFRRNVPHYVSSIEPSSHQDSSAAFYEYHTAHRGKDLVLKDMQLAPTTSTTETYYHPFNERYVAPLWGSGVEYVGTDAIWEVAQEGRMYYLEGYINVAKAGETKLWVPQLSREFDLNME